MSAKCRHLATIEQMINKDLCNKKLINNINYLYSKTISKVQLKIKHIQEYNKFKFLNIKFF